MPAVLEVIVDDRVATRRNERNKNLKVMRKQWGLPTIELSTKLITPEKQYSSRETVAVLITGKPYILTQ